MHKGSAPVAYNLYNCGGAVKAKAKAKAGDDKNFRSQRKILGLARFLARR